jgi:hypothetical protein
VKVYIKNNLFPTCPGGGAAYTIGAVNTDPTCSLSAAGHILTPP